MAPVQLAFIAHELRHARGAQGLAADAVHNVYAVPVCKEGRDEVAHPHRNAIHLRRNGVPNNENAQLAVLAQGGRGKEPQRNLHQPQPCHHTRKEQKLWEELMRVKRNLQRERKAWWGGAVLLRQQAQPGAGE